MYVSFFRTKKWLGKYDPAFLKTRTFLGHPVHFFFQTMKNYLILLLLYTFTIDPSKSIDLEATSTEEYTNADTTTKADLLENPRNEDIEITGKVEEIKNNDDNPGVVIPLERILAG